MVRLVAIIYSMAATALAGIAVTVVLTMGWLSVPAIVGAAVIGALVAVPVSVAVARALA